MAIHWKQYWKAWYYPYRKEDMSDETKITLKRGRPKIVRVPLVAPEWRSTAHALDVLATIAYPIPFGNESPAEVTEEVGDTTLYLPDPYSDRKVELFESIATAYGLKCRRGKRINQLPAGMSGQKGIQRWRPVTFFGPRHVREVVTATYEYAVAHADDLVEEVLPLRPVETHKRVYMNNWWDGYRATITPMIGKAIESARKRHPAPAGEVEPEYKIIVPKSQKRKGPSHARKILPEPVPVVAEPREALVSL